MKCSALCQMVIRTNGFLNLFGFLWLIETTWLDLPVSLQTCALPGLGSALFYGCLCLHVVIIEFVHLSPLLGTVLHTDINSICLPVFLINKENVLNNERVERPEKKRYYLFQMESSNSHRYHCENKLRFSCQKVKFQHAKFSLIFRKTDRITKYWQYKWCKYTIRLQQIITHLNLFHIY